MLLTLYNHLSPPSGLDPSRYFFVYIFTKLINDTNVNIFQSEQPTDSKIFWEQLQWFEVKKTSAMVFWRTEYLRGMKGWRRGLYLKRMNWTDVRGSVLFVQCDDTTNHKFISQAEPSRYCSISYSTQHLYVYILVPI